MKIRKQYPEQDRLRELFDYKDGCLIRKIKTSNKTFIGQVAGGFMTNGYHHANVDGNSYLTHRLIWIYHNGSIDPKINIDHIDRNPGNNRIENLRLADQKQNCQNNKISKNNTSGYNGVYWHKLAKKWMAYIKVNRKRIHLGLYENIADAVKARSDYEAKLNWNNF